MKLIRSIFFALCITLLPSSSALMAQNGKIVEQQPFDISAYLKKEVSAKIEKNQFRSIDYKYLQGLKIYKIKYLSDGLKVAGFLVMPENEQQKYPCIIYNRGGNQEFGAITDRKVINILARIASWGYVVVGSQYRGNMGGEGKEEFGGKDVNDVLNLIPLLGTIPVADTSRIGIFGWSRGGMMTYLTLARTDKIKAAVIGGGLSDLFLMKNSRPEMEEVYEELIPNYRAKKESSLIARSAIRWTEKICKKTPILMLHGTADWRVVPQMALELANAFLRVKQPFRLVMLEGGDHGLTEFDDEVFRQTREWFDRFVRDRAPLPNLTPHGR